MAEEYIRKKMKERQRSKQEEIQKIHEFKSLEEEKMKKLMFEIDRKREEMPIKKGNPSIEFISNMQALRKDQENTKKESDNNKRDQENPKKDQENETAVTIQPIRYQPNPLKIR